MARGRQPAGSPQMRQGSVNLPVGDWDALRYAAYIHGRDTAEEIRAAVAEYLNRLAIDPDFVARMESMPQTLREIRGSAA